MTDRIITAHLADLSHTLPMPNGGGRLFSADDAGEQIDGWDGFWIAALKDGSIKEGTRPPAGEPVAIEPVPTSDSPTSHDEE